MHPMFKPENLYAFGDSNLNRQRIEQFCHQLQTARSSDDLWLMGQKAHWFLCAFYHGCREQFEEASTLIRSALDEAEERIGGAA